MKSKRVLAVILGCMLLLFCTIGCEKEEQVEERGDALDPLGYAAAGYYGKTPEELKELLPGIETLAWPSMKKESKITDNISCKQVFYFNENELVEIQYWYIFDIGEEAERKFVEQCRRLYEIDQDIDDYVTQCVEFSLSLDGFLNGPLSPIGEDGLFWKKIIESMGNDNYLITYSTFCDEENIRGLNREAEPQGWKDEYEIEIRGYFYHWYMDWDDPFWEASTHVQRSNASFLGGKEAQIL